MRNDKIKKMEVELRDLEEWLKLGLVPKKDEEKHKLEIAAVTKRISDEQAKLRALRDGEEMEEFVTPKRTTRTAFTEQTTIAELDMETNMHYRNRTSISDDTSFSGDTETADMDTATSDGDDDSTSAEDDDVDPFSDTQRLRRGWDRDVIDPDSDDW